MELKALSIRPFIGAENFRQSADFYSELGFAETRISPTFSLFRNESIGFYLQDFYVREWMQNTVVFLEVQNMDKCHSDLQALKLHEKFQGVKLSPLMSKEWGRECFLHDPSGALWHFGEFVK